MQWRASVPSERKCEIHFFTAFSRHLQIMHLLHQNRGCRYCVHSDEAEQVFTGTKAFFWHCGSESRRSLCFWIRCKHCLVHYNTDGFIWWCQKWRIKTWTQLGATLPPENPRLYPVSLVLMKLSLQSRSGLAVWRGNFNELWKNCVMFSPGAEGWYC